jgi:chromate transporter
MITYLLLFVEFFKTGLFAIGGGLATIPFLREMCHTHPTWFNEELLGNMIAVGESTPGPIGVNVATYVGYTVGYGEFGLFGGILGGFITTLGLVLPSVIIIVIIAKLLTAFKENKLVARTFYSIRPAVVGMIASAAITMIKSGVFTKEGNLLQQIDIKAAILFAVILAATNIKPIKKLLEHILK